MSFGWRSISLATVRMFIAPNRWHCLHIEPYRLNTYQQNSVQQKLLCDSWRFLVVLSTIDINFSLNIARMSQLWEGDQFMVMITLEMYSWRQVQQEKEDMTCIIHVFENRRKNPCNRLIRTLLNFRIPSFECSTIRNPIDKFKFK